MLKWTPNATSRIEVANCHKVQPDVRKYREDLGSPRAIFVDNVGNLYVTISLGYRLETFLAPNVKTVVTYYGYTVEKWPMGSVQGVTIAEFKNSLNQGKHGDSFGLHIDIDDNIYLSDEVYHYVFKFDPNQQNHTEIVAGDVNGNGNGSHQLNEPKQIYVDRFGNIYIADSKNHRIQKWKQGAKQGITVAGGNGQGSQPNQLDTPMGVWVDSYGNIFISDTSNNRIQKWSVNATFGVTVAGDYGKGSSSLQLNYPRSITLDSNGNIYVADAGNRRVQKFLLESGSSC